MKFFLAKCPHTRLMISLFMLITNSVAISEDPHPTCPDTISHFIDTLVSCGYIVTYSFQESVNVQYC